MDSPVIWTSIHQKQKRRLYKWLIITNLFFFLLCTFLYLRWFDSLRIHTENLVLAQRLKEYRARDEIFNILRPKGMSLAQGIDVANALILHSKENNIPLELSIKIMGKESEYHVNAISNKGAAGLMQLMPKTFDDYNEAFKMGLGKQAIFDPIINIRIALLHLKDLIKENKTLEEALQRYSGGAEGYGKSVIKGSEELKGKLK